MEKNYTQTSQITENLQQKVWQKYTKDLRELETKTKLVIIETFIKKEVNKIKGQIKNNKLEIKKIKDLIQKNIKINKVNIFEKELENLLEHNVRIISVKNQLNNFEKFKFDLYKEKNSISTIVHKENRDFTEQENLLEEEIKSKIEILNENIHESIKFIEMVFLSSIMQTPGFRKFAKETKWE